ncbi:hypothetical protein HDV03_001375 [Kappamyces sp. JEL0829]|nr:hypothetical protein HDV03_001375 [Kappamyces sp. JEL0829]
MQSLAILPLTQKSFEPYGDVLACNRESRGGSMANQGSATRFNHLTQLVNLRNGKEWGVAQDLQSPPARLNVCIFHSLPREIPFSVKLLERHKYSSQAFIPMSSQPCAYLVVVARNDPVRDQPDMSTLRAFMASSLQAFNYHAGTWHHPMIALYAPIDFLCLVYERGPDQADAQTEDTEEIFFPSSPILLSPPKSPAKL